MPTYQGCDAAASRPSHRVSGKADAVVFERDRADAFAGRVEIRIEHGWRGNADRRLADTAPRGVSGRHDDRLDLGHLGDAHRVVGVEILLLDATTPDSAFAVEQRGEAVYE